MRLILIVIGLLSLQGCYYGSSYYSYGKAHPFYHKNPYYNDPPYVTEQELEIRRKHPNWR